MSEPQPRGRFLARDVGLLAGVSGDQVGQWARRGYIRPSVSDGSPHVYSFEDVEEAIVVHELRESGASLEAIRQAITYLRSLEREIDWPLSAAQLAVTSGGSTIVTVTDMHEDGYQWSALAVDASAHPGHALLDVNDLTRIRGELMRGGWAVKQLPDLKYIEVNPDRLSGTPTIRGRRLAAEEVAIAAENGDVVRLKQDYELSDPEISDAVRWWAVARQFEQAA